MQPLRIVTVPTDTVLGFKPMQHSDASQFVWSTTLSPLWSGAYVQLRLAEAISYVPNQYDRGHAHCLINLIRTKKPMQVAICDNQQIANTALSSLQKAQLVVAAARLTPGLQWQDEYFKDNLSEAFGKLETVLMLWDCENKEIIVPRSMFNNDWLTLETLLTVRQSATIAGGVIGHVIGQNEQIDAVVQSLLVTLSKWEIADAVSLAPLLANVLQNAGTAVVAPLSSLSTCSLGSSSLNSSSSSFATTLLSDPDPILLHSMTSFCTLQSLAACACVSAAWCANLTWLLQSTADPTPVPQHPWLLTDTQSQAKANDWSRSYTLYEGMRRHALLPHDPGTPPRTSWCIHVVGTDAVEGDTVDTTVAVFAPLCALLLKDFNVSNVSNVSNVQPKDTMLTLTVVLNGMDLLVPRSIKTSSSSSTSNKWSGIVHGITLVLLWCPGEYTFDLFQANIKPNMIVCFNAGLWGYSTWHPTLLWIVKDAECPLVVTSYTWKESEDDEEVMNEVMQEAIAETKETTKNDEKVICWKWKSERNPYGSTIKKKSHHADEYLRDNSWWMSTK